MRNGGESETQRWWVAVIDGRLALRWRNLAVPAASVEAWWEGFSRPLTLRERIVWRLFARAPRPPAP